jgi:hypothetical protein
MAGGGIWTSVTDMEFHYEGAGGMTVTDLGTAVPEPCAALLALCGALALAARRCALRPRS